MIRIENPSYLMKLEEKKHNCTKDAQNSFSCCIKHERVHVTYSVMLISRTSRLINVKKRLLG